MGNTITELYYREGQWKNGRADFSEPAKVRIQVLDSTATGRHSSTSSWITAYTHSLVMYWAWIVNMCALRGFIGPNSDRYIPTSGDEKWVTLSGGSIGGAMGAIAPPPYGFKKIFFLNIFTVKYWKIVDFLIKVVKITPKTHHPKKSPPVIHAGSYLRRRNRRIPSNSRNFIDYPPPPLEIGPENSSNYPPRIHGTSSTTPPRNRAGKLLQLPPLEFTELHRLPPPPRNRAGKLSPPVTRWSGSATGNTADGQSGAEYI